MVEKGRKMAGNEERREGDDGRRKQREREREMMEGKMGKMTAEEINDGRRRRGRMVAEEIRKKKAGK